MLNPQVDVTDDGEVTAEMIEATVIWVETEAMAGGNGSGVELDWIP